MLHFEGPDSRCEIGGNSIVSPGGQDFMAVVVDGRYLLGFRFEDGAYLLQFLYLDAHNKLLLKITDNELVFRAGFWDFEWTANRLVIREGLRRIILELEFQPPDTLIVHRGELHFNGVRIDIKRDLLTVGGQSYARIGVVGGYVGLNIGHDQSHRILEGVSGISRPRRLPGYELQDILACPRCKVERHHQGRSQPDWFGNA
jgi:hypothetical protein